MAEGDNDTLEPYDRCRLKRTLPGWIAPGAVYPKGQRYRVVRSLGDDSVECELEDLIDGQHWPVIFRREDLEPI